MYTKEAKAFWCGESKYLNTLIWKVLIAWNFLSSSVLGEKSVVT